MSLRVDLGFALRTAVLVADAALTEQHHHGEGSGDILDLDVLRAYVGAIGDVGGLWPLRALDLATHGLVDATAAFEARTRLERPAEIAAIAAAQTATTFRLFSLALGEQLAIDRPAERAARPNPVELVIDRSGILAAHSTMGSIERLRYCLATTLRNLADPPGKPA